MVSGGSTWRGHHLSFVKVFQLLDSSRGGKVVRPMKGALQLLGSHGVALQHLSSPGELQSREDCYVCIPDARSCTAASQLTRSCAALLGSPGLALEHLSSHGDLQSREDC